MKHTITKSAPEGGKPTLNYDSYIYTQVNKQKHSEEESTQAMKLNYSLYFQKDTTENAPRGGKQKTINKAKLKHKNPNQNINKQKITLLERTKSDNKT